jgi:MYXO-CTERM domain-containing protein
MRRHALAVLAFAIPSTAAAAGTPISANAPWARGADDELTRPVVERLTGKTKAEIDAIGSRWEGDMLFTPDGMGADALAAMGLDPLHAMAYEPSAGILFVEMAGVTLSPTCGSGDTANAALNCTPLVSSETQFPAYGDGAAQASMFQELQNYYEPFNIIMSANRPPDWLPYTMAVIGGASNQGAGVCGVANVACDGLKRNHVSLTFPESCGGVADIAAQETSHNWGLEHTDNTQDLMYPFNNGGFKTYIDDCMDISHATGNGVTQCGYIHELYCEAGGGEQQNSYQELLGVFGPRAVDDVAPVITSITPEDGAVLSTSDSITITATVEENSTFMGAKWTWIEGLPEDVPEYTRCTNNVCTEDYALVAGTDPNTVAWDFLNLAQPPAGTYTFSFEVIDGYGNYDAREITFEVVEGGETDPTDPTEADTTDGDPTDSDTNDDEDEDGETDDDDGDGGSTGASTAGQTPGDASKQGCACLVDDRGTPGGLAALSLLVVGAVRRRRR